MSLTKNTRIQDPINNAIATQTHGSKTFQTKHCMTEEQIHILSKGLNYNTKDASKLHYIADLDNALKNARTLPEESKERIHHQITTNLLHKKRSIDLTKQERHTNKDLKSDDKIIILPAVILQIRLH